MIINSKKKLDMRIVGSIRSSYVRQKIIENYPKILKNEKQIRKEYLRGVNILRLSNEYDFPPLHLIKIIFSKYFDKDELKEILNIDNLKKFKN